MNKTSHWHEAYQIIGKHLFIAYPTDVGNSQQAIIIADTLDQAEIIARRHWLNRELCVRHAQQVGETQIYE